MAHMRYRRARHLWFSLPLWRKRIVFGAGALIVGVIAAVFAMAADESQKGFFELFHAYPLAPLLVMPLGFGLSAYLAKKLFDGSQGSGIPQVMAARLVRDHDVRARLMAPKLIVGKVALTLLGLLVGASIGREGPTVQVGAALMFLFASKARMEGQRGVVLAGAAAGVAAAFNTPLAGIVFAIEEMARAFEHRNNSLVLLAIIISGVAAIFILGNYTYFGHTDIPLDFLQHWPAVLVLGLLGGAAGALFNRLVIETGPWARERLTRIIPVKNIFMFAACCGLLSAVIGLLTGGDTFGTGYEIARAALQEGAPLHWWYAPAKLLSTALASMSGMPGGLFSPSLSVGAGIGAALGPLFADTAVPGLILLGMVAYFAGVTQAPITAFVIVLEMTGDHHIVVPLMAAAVLATGVSRLICPVPIYQALAKMLMRQLAAEKLEAEKQASAAEAGTGGSDAAKNGGKAGGAA